MDCSGKSTRRSDYCTQLRRAIAYLLPARGVPLCSDDQRVRWSDRLLLIGLLLLIWHPSSSLRAAFDVMRDEVVAMYPTRRRPGRHLEGFLKTWRKRSARLLAQLTAVLRQRTRQWAGERWRWNGWVLLGVDGSRINAPRTRANEQAFGCAGKQRTTPQQLLVSLFQISTGLPWAWRRTRGDGSERDLLLEMLPELPDRTLLLADAGFVGYRVLTRLQAAGHAFVVRVGRNVTLLRKLGYHLHERGNIVYLWPGNQRGQAPLTLRLVTVQSERRRVALLTNVLDENELCDAQVAGLYRQRWSLEVMYRSLKQTLGKGKLRAQTPDLAACELDWSMAGLWLIGLMSQSQIKRQQGWSAAAALRVVRTAARRGPRRVACKWLQRQLRDAVRDTYVRLQPKQARDWPHKKHEPPPGEPKIRTATRAEIRQAQAFLRKNHAA